MPNLELRYPLSSQILVKIDTYTITRFTKLGPHTRIENRNKRTGNKLTVTLEKIRMLWSYLISKVIEKSIHDPGISSKKWTAVLLPFRPKNKSVHRCMFLLANKFDFKLCWKWKTYCYDFNRSSKGFWHFRSLNFVRQNDLHQFFR